MTEYEYPVSVPLPGGGGVLEICVCHTPEAVGAVVAALCAAASQPAAEVRVTARPRIERRV